MILIFHFLKHCLLKLFIQNGCHVEIKRGEKRESKREEGGNKKERKKERERGEETRKEQKRRENDKRAEV